MPSVTAGPGELIVANTETGRGTLASVDGVKTKGIQTGADVKYQKNCFGSLLTNCGGIFW
jgi:adenosine/AMP kinase